MLEIGQYFCEDMDNSLWLTSLGHPVYKQQNPIVAIVTDCNERHADNLILKNLYQNFTEDRQNIVPAISATYFSDFSSPIPFSNLFTRATLC